MKVKTFFLTLCGATLLSAAAAFCAPADWFLLDENQESSFFFDKNSINLVREGVIEVRTRVVYSDQGRKEALKLLKGLPADAPLYETLYSYQINCPEREGHLLASSHFDKAGAALKSSDLSALTQWEYLPPGSRMGLVLQQACPR